MGEGCWRCCQSCLVWRLWFGVLKLSFSFSPFCIWICPAKSYTLAHGRGRVFLCFVFFFVSDCIVPLSFKSLSNILLFIPGPFYDRAPERHTDSARHNADWKRSDPKFGTFSMDSTPTNAPTNERPLKRVKLSHDSKPLRIHFSSLLIQYFDIRRRQHRSANYSERTRPRTPRPSTPATDHPGPY